MAQPPHKHVIDVTNSAEAGAAVRTIQLALGVLNPDPYTNVTNVKAGSKVTMITVMLDCMQEVMNSGTIDYLDWYIWFNINGAQGQPQPALVGSNHLKTQVFHQEQCLIDFYTSRTDAGWVRNPSKVFRLNISIPRSWQIVNDGDAIELVYKYAAGLNHTTKCKAIYKEIYP